MAKIICFNVFIDRLNHFCLSIFKTRFNHTISYKFSAISFTFFFLVITAFSAQAGGFNIDVGSDGIEGYADKVPLNQVLTRLAQKTGYRIYLNEKLKAEPVSFFINKKIHPEKAIKLIIHPHSYAMVFGGRKDINNSNILEVKVFPRGEIVGKYVALNSTSRDLYSVTSEAKSGSGVFSTSFESRADSGRSLDKIKINNKPYAVEKSAFGTPVIKKKGGAQGPNYSLNSHEMRKAYQRYLSEKREYQHRMATSVHKKGYLLSKKEKQEYISDRQQVYKNLVNDEKISY